MSLPEAGVVSKQAAGTIAGFSRFEIAVAWPCVVLSCANWSKAGSTRYDHYRNLLSKFLGGTEISS
jgi:hypothetical protein